MNPVDTLHDALSAVPGSNLDAGILAPETATTVVRSLAPELAALGLAGVRVHPAAVSSVAAVGAEMGEVSPDGRAPRIGTVAGFPSGRSHVLVKAAEARLAVDSGAQDVAVVVDPSLVAVGDASGVLMELAALREAVSAPVQLTAVVETGFHRNGLIDDRELTAVVEAAATAGVDAVATTTGFHSCGVGGARQVELVAAAVSASAGIGVIAVMGDDETPAFARELLEAGAHVVQVNCT